MAENQSNRAGLATASLVLGIVTIVVSLWWFLAVITGVLAIIFGALAIKSSGRGKALAGIITGSIGIVLSVLIILAVLAALPVLQQSQRDTARQNELTSLSTEVTAYMASNRGALPTVNDFVEEDGSFIQTITDSGEPTTGTVVYTTGKNCDGDVSARAYSLRIMLESGSEYCTGS